jgi:hypothetical protein
MNYLQIKELKYDYIICKEHLSLKRLEYDKLNEMNKQSKERIYLSEDIKSLEEELKRLGNIIKNIRYL